MSTPERSGTIRQAINEALLEEMQADPSIILMGEDVGVAGGVFKVTSGSLQAVRPVTVLDTPIAEAGIMGLAVGAAMTGLRPVIEIMFCDFLTLASDQLINQAAKLRYMTGGQCSVPLVVRSAMSASRRAASTPEPPGLALSHPRPQGRDAGHSRGCKGAAEERDPR